MTDQWGAIYELAAMGEDEMEPISYSAKMHRQDPESWAQRAEAKAASIEGMGWGEIREAAVALGMIEDEPPHPAAENIAAAFER